MALTVGTNSGALMAQAAASSVNKSMENSMERLATGKRINSAADDAAGVAIASRLTSEIRGTNQAIRNAMDGQAMIDTAEGAHQEIENILQRMRELAVQAANDTNNADDRVNLQAEVTSLSTEIDRISSTTTWAGQKLLDATGGTSGTFDLQVGSRNSANDEISVTIGSMSSSTLGVGAANNSSGGAKITEMGHNAMQLTGQMKAGDQIKYSIGGVAKVYSVVAADVTHATAALDQAGVATKVAAQIAGLTGSHAGISATSTANVVTVNQDIVTFSNVAVESISTASAASHVVSGKNITLDFSTAGFTNGQTIASFSVNGVAISVTDSIFSAGSKYGGSRAGMIEAIKDQLAVTANANKLKGLTFSIAAGTATDQIRVDVITSDNTAGFLTGVTANPAAGSSTINLNSATNAQTAVGLIDTAIKSVNTQRATLGAVSNRLDSTVSNLTNISTNLSAGKGRIEDADFAAETTNLAKTQILQQASTAMLAQANASKQGVLSLLQG
jgi:flagellin